VDEKPRESKRWRKRIAERWVIPALANIARIEGIALRKLEEKLSLCDFYGSGKDEQNSFHLLFMQCGERQKASC